MQDLRLEMVEKQLRRRGITDKRVLKVMSEVPREDFIPPSQKHLAYEDFPLPIGDGQTISQPYMVALMTQLLQLKGDEKVLEVGCGSGYQAAVLSKLCRKVISVEIVEKLAKQAKTTLEKYNVKVIIGDGSAGYVYGAPYDRIIVTAAASEVPSELLDQLNVGGRLVIPVGGRALQTLRVLTKKKGQVVEEKSVGCRFVLLTGKRGFM